MAAKIVILGGYGNTGRALARLLLEHSDVSLVLCGRSGERASAEAATWNGRYPGARVLGVAADARDRASLLRAFSGAEVVVVASSTAAVVANVAEAALEVGLDYLDPQYSRDKLRLLRSMAPRFEAAGRCFVTDGGFHPGLPAVLVRFAATQIERLTTARVGSVIQIDWKDLEIGSSTVDELIAEFRDFQSMTYEDGRWRSLGWLESLRPEWMRFGHAMGRRYTMPMYLEEMRSLPDMIPSLEQTGFYVGGFNPVVDWVVIPLGWLLAWLSPGAGSRIFGRMLLWGLRGFSRPPYGTLLQLEASGTHHGVPMALRLIVYHQDGYVLTAAPMVACLFQMLDGTARRPGLHCQALLVEPDRMLTDLIRLGIDVEVQGPSAELPEADA